MNTQINLNQPLIQPSSSTGCKASSLTSQFACPTGLLGGGVGRLMAVKNAKMNEFAVEMLDIQPDDQALEIGFGHGRTIRMIAERAKAGFVAGVDLSDVMVRQATRYNLDLIVAGRAELCQGSVADLPYECGRFTKVLAVNNYQFWPDAELNLEEMRRVMREGGLVVICLRMHSTKRLALAPGFTEDEVTDVARLVRWVGFSDIRIVKRKVGREASCVIARR
ncbi:MAG TPA: class I SAM-dependent methyltransferase [Blastocatellia bacterium]|nr:class I SAM-dependent methyltransferase [Blastocatellia bacterium]